MQDTLSSLNILKSTLTGTMTTGQNSRNKCANSLDIHKHHDQHQSSDKSSQSKNNEGKLLSLKCSLTNGTSINSTKPSFISSTSSSWQSPVSIDPPKKPTPHFIVNILGLTKENDRNGQSSSSSIPVTNNKANAVPKSSPSIVTTASSSLPSLTSSSSASISESSASTNEKFIDHHKSSSESKPAKKFCKTKCSSAKSVSKTKHQRDSLAETPKVQSNSGAKTNKKHPKSNLNIQQPLNLSFSSNLMPNSSSPVPPRLSSYSGKSRKQSKTAKNTDEVSKKSRPSSITRGDDTSLDKYQCSALDLSKNCRGTKRKKESKASPLTTISSNLTQSSSSSPGLPLSLFASLQKDSSDLVKSSTSPPITAINTLSSCSSPANSSLITAIKEKVSKNEVSGNAHIIARSASVSTMSNDSCSSRLSDPSLDNGLTIVETSSVDGGPNSPSDRSRKKKARTTFTGRQIFELEKQFEIKKYLSSSERSEMARLLNVTETQVKIWFQNRRTKWKKQDGITNAQAAEHRVSGTEKTSSTGRKSKNHKNQSSTSSVSSNNCDNTTGNENLPETEQNLVMNASISLAKSGHNLNLYASDTCEDGDLGMNNDSNSDSMSFPRHNPYSPMFSEEENSSKAFRISKANSVDRELDLSSTKTLTSEGLSDHHIDFSSQPNEPDSDSSPAPLRIAEKEENDEEPSDERLNGFPRDVQSESATKKNYCKDENTDSNNDIANENNNMKCEAKSSEKHENNLKIGVNELIKCN